MPPRPKRLPPSQLMNEVKRKRLVEQQKEFDIKITKDDIRKKRNEYVKTELKKIKTMKENELDEVRRMKEERDPELRRKYKGEERKGKLEEIRTEEKKK